MDPFGATLITLLLLTIPLWMLAWAVMYPRKLAEFLRHEWRDR